MAVNRVPLIMVRLCTKSGLVGGVEVEAYVDLEAEHQTSFFSEYTTLAKRNFMRQKDRYLSGVWIVQTLFTAFAIGIVWFVLPRTEDTGRDRFGLVSGLLYQAISGVGR